MEPDRPFRRFNLRWILAYSVLLLGLLSLPATCHTSSPTNKSPSKPILPTAKEAVQVAQVAQAVLPQAATLAVEIPAAGRSVPFADAKAMLSGPSNLVAGRAGIYKCTGSTGKNYRWLIIPKEAEEWFTPILIDRGDGGQDRAGLVIPEQAITFYVTFIAYEGDKLDYATIEVNRGAAPGPAPQPAPEPGPGPGPGPGPVPPGPSPDPNADEWSKWTAEAAQRLVQQAVEQRRSTARKLASAFDEVCKACASVSDTKEARQMLAKATFDACAEEERKAWLEFSKAMDTEVRKSVDAGNIKTVRDYVKVWTSISKGLKSF